MSAGRPERDGLDPFSSTSVFRSEQPEIADDPDRPAVIEYNRLFGYRNM